MNETLKASLLLCVPNKYSLEWSGKENAPIRYKLDHYFQNRKSIQQLNSLWIDALAKITNSNPIELDKYLRINAPINGDVVYISVFPNATIMIQGDQAIEWARSNLENVCNEVNSYIEDHFYSIDVSGSIIPDKTSTSVLGICMICDSFDDDEMLECRNEKCRSWYHNKCEGLTETEARKISPYFCRNCREKYSLDMGATSLSPSKKEQKACETEKEINITNNHKQLSPPTSPVKDKDINNRQASQKSLPINNDLCNKGKLSKQKPLKATQAPNGDKTSRPNWKSQNVCNLPTNSTQNNKVQSSVKTQARDETNTGSQTKSSNKLNLLERQVLEKPSQSNTSTPIPSRKIEQRKYPTSPIQETAPDNNQTVIGNIQSKLKGMSSYMMDVLGLSKYESSDDEESQTSDKDNTTTPSVLIGDSKEQSSTGMESSIDSSLYEEDNQSNLMISDDDDDGDTSLSRSASTEERNVISSKESQNVEINQKDQMNPIDNAANETRSSRSATKESQTETPSFDSKACQTSNDETFSNQIKFTTEQTKKRCATSQTDPVGKNTNEEKIKHLEFLLEESNQKNEKLRNEVGLYEEINSVTGNKVSNKNKEKYEHRSYNELLKECHKLEERNTKLFSTMNVIKEEKNRYKQIVTSLKEENQSLQTEVETIKLSSSQNTSMIEEINVLKDQMSNERLAINKMNELLNETNKKMECQRKQEKELMDQIIKISKENNDLKLEKSKLLIKNLKLQSNDWQTIDEAESNLNSSFSSISSIETDEPKSDINSKEISIIGIETSANAPRNPPKRNGTPAKERRNPTERMHTPESTENIDSSVLHLGSQPIRGRRHPTDPAGSILHQESQPTRGRRHPTGPDGDPESRTNDRNLRHQHRISPENRMLPSEPNNNPGRKTDYDNPITQRRPKSRGYRPICPWFIKGRCNSQFCIYHHPQSRYPNPSDQKNRYNNQPEKTETEKQRSYQTEERYNKTCKYFLENRCIFGEACYYKHPTEM